MVKKIGGWGYMPKVVDRDAYKDELLSKCFNIFAQYGYDKVTMRTIAQKIGVSTGTLYHYFPNKQAIIKALFDWVMRTNIGDAFNRMHEIDDIENRIDIASEFWKEYGQYYQKVMLLAFDLWRNSAKDESQPVFLSFSQYYRDAMVRIFNISEEFSELLFVIFLGSVFHSIITSDHFSYNNTVDTITQLISKEKGIAHNKAKTKRHIKLVR